MFYNGVEDEPEERELRLSDSFVNSYACDKKPCVEVIVQLLNINYGCNRELMQKCQKLMEYSKFISLVRETIDSLLTEYRNGMKAISKKEVFAEAVSLAINEAIRNNILKDILSNNKAEVTDMLLTEFDEKAYIEGVKKQSYKDGQRDGELAGEQKGEARIAELISKLMKDGREEDIGKVTEKKERERLYKEYNI